MNSKKKPPLLPFSHLRFTRNRKSPLHNFSQSSSITPNKGQNRTLSSRELLRANEGVIHLEMLHFPWLTVVNCTGVSNRNVLGGDFELGEPLVTFSDFCESTLVNLPAVVPFLLRIKLFIFWKSLTNRVRYMRGYTSLPLILVSLRVHSALRPFSMFWMKALVLERISGAWEEKWKFH